MLTRLKVHGFKNLVKVDVRFGPFTCIAGANGVGKSNLFDAIKFLSDLADRSLIDAAMSVRDESGKVSDVQGIFRKFKATDSTSAEYDDEMSFEVEIIVPKDGVDDLGQLATATSTFLRYRLRLAHRKNQGLSSVGALEIIEEELTHFTAGESVKLLLFEPSKSWRDDVILNKRRAGPYISTEGGPDNRIIKLHVDGKVGGSPVKRNAKTLPRTVLSSTNAVENPTALLVRNEMRSWRLLQLEPSALRKPDEFTAPVKLGEDGSHIASTLYHLAQVDTSENSNGRRISDSKVYGHVAARLSELISDVFSVNVDRDEKRELLTLELTTLDRVSYPAKALSDGTLRFLALAVLELDSEAQGVLCLEEPENGIHPARIPASLRLLEDIAIDVDYPTASDNPLRQIIINTHSPVVVQQVEDQDLLCAELKGAGVTFGCLPETWRAKEETSHIVSRGLIGAYLNPTIAVLPDTREIAIHTRKRHVRVIDRMDLQPFLPFGAIQ